MGKYKNDISAIISMIIIVGDNERLQKFLFKLYHRTFLSFYLSKFQSVNHIMILPSYLLDSEVELQKERLHHRYRVLE